MARILIGIIAIMLAGTGLAAEKSPTLKRIAERGSLTIGYVPDAPPMSYLTGDGKAAGYSVELCRRVATAVRRSLGRDELTLKYVPLIAPEERIAAVENGTVDIECGATTVTMSRRERVDFSLMTFITGGSVLSTSKAPIATTAGVDGKTIAVIRGTTTEQALRDFSKVNDFTVSIEYIATHDDGMRALDEGRVDGYASDRTMLIGQALQSADAAKYAIARDVFSFEPYALMLPRGDTGFRLVVDRALAGIYRSAAIQRLYHDWFGSRGQPMTPVLKAMYEFQGVPD